MAFQRSVLGELRAALTGGMRLILEKAVGGFAK
jgi:hypothetical protein